MHGCLKDYEPLPERPSQFSTNLPLFILAGMFGVIVLVTVSVWPLIRPAKVAPELQPYLTMRGYSREE